jgi:transposase-like protein
MREDTTITCFQQPGTINDPLTEIAREGARQMLMVALKAEAASFVAQFAEERLPDGRQRVVHHGHGPERTIQTGIGPIPVHRQKVRDRATGGPPGTKIRFTSAILPKWARRTPSLDALLPVLYLRGVSTGDFQEALAALLGTDAPNLSPSVIARLTQDWQAEYDRWQQRDLSARRYLYIWADGVYLQARLEDTASCMLVITGATPEGKKELLGFQVGERESAQSWRELLIDLKKRGFAVAPEIAVGDGAMGFWKAIEEVFPSTRHQRCPRQSADCRHFMNRMNGLLAIHGEHKMLNILNKVPKSVQPGMKEDLREVRDAPDRTTAEGAIDVFVEKYQVKYSKAVECLTKDREPLLAFFDFPAEPFAAFWLRPFHGSDQRPPCL